MQKLLAVLLVVAANAFAAESDVRDSKLTLQAFGAVAASKFSRSVISTALDNPRDEIGFNRNTRFGLNVAYRYSDKLEAYSQLMTRRTPDQDYAQIDLLAVKYHFNDQSALYFGRVIMPTFLFSEQADVGVTYPWLEPPMNTYPLNPVKSLEGVRLIFRPESTNHRFQVDLYAGNGGSHFSNLRGASYNIYDAKLREGAGLNLELESKVNDDDRLDYRVRLGAVTGQVRLDTWSEVANSSLISPTAKGTSRLYTSYNLEQLQLYTAGLHLKFKGTELISEYALRKSSGVILSQPSALDPAVGPILPRTSVAYGTLLHRFGRFVPHYTYYKILENEGTLRPHPDVGVGNAALLDSITAHTFGLNYEVDPSVIVKAQVTMLKESWSNSASDLEGYLGSIGADFVFF